MPAKELDPEVKQILLENPGPTLSYTQVGHILTTISRYLKEHPEEIEIRPSGTLRREAERFGVMVHFDAKKFTDWVGQKRAEQDGLRSDST